MPNWKKVIVSGSDALLNTLTVSNGVQITGSLLVTGSTVQTGNNTLIGNTNLSGSINVTGSQTFIGNLSLTGSFLVSGSTTQVGNNTLLGNTVLSGSIVISGSVAPGNLSASVNIYGDTALSGFLRFNPYATNIDASISASYIYVSGSTNDLYFAQNGNGYNNVTRLRWLEGNLYTGLLNGGLITTQSSTVYQVASGSGLVVSLNASLNDNPYPTITYVNWGNLSASIAPLTASYDQTFIAINSSGSIVVQGTPFYDGQLDTQIPIGLVLHQNHSTINGVKTQPSVAYGWKQRSNIFTTAFGPLKLSGFTLAASGSSTGSLVVGSGTGYADGANYTIDPNNPSYVTDNGTSVSKIYRYYQSGSDWVYNTNGGAGYGAIDPTQYSNNGVLTAVPGTGANREWTNQRVYWFANSVAKAIVVYYGNQTYVTETEAIANANIESFIEAPNTAANAIYLGFITVRNNANFTDATSYKIVPGGLFRQIGGSGGGGSIVTQTLAGLSDVAISSPTNGQPLVYNSTSLKWENQSTLTATLIGNATTATTASYASTASYVITAQTASYYGGSVTSASFASTASYAAESLLTTNVKGAANRILFNNGTNTTTTSNELTWTDNINLLTLGTATGTAGTINKLALYTSSFGGYGFGVSPGQLDYVTDGSHVFYKNGVTPTELLRITNAGNVSIAGTLTVTGSIAGSLVGTASYATQALSASFAPSTPTFPFTGSAIITGSLTVIGNTTMTGSLIVSGSTSTNLLVGTNALYVSSSGRVGLGVTSSLAATLHVKGGTFPAQLIGTTTDTSWDIAPLNIIAKSAAEGYNYGYSPAINIRRNGNNSYPSINFVQNSPTSFGAIVWQDASYPSYTAATTGTHALIQAYNSSTVGIFSIATNSAIGTTGVATMLQIIGNKMAIGTVTPTSLLHLSAGTAAANTAPLKLTAGTNLTTPEAGAIEFDGSNLFFTTGSTRQIAVAATSALTSSRIPYANGNGRLIDSANLTYGATANTLHVEGGSTNTLFELTRAGEITYKYNINSSNALNITTTTSDTEYYFLRGNKFGIGVSATARLHIVGGTATANTAPIKFTAGTNLTTPEAGTIEFDGNSLFFTTGSTRSTILTNISPASITGNLVVTGSLLVSGSVRLNGNAGVNITGNTVITGSLLVSGSSLVAGITPIPLAGTIRDGVTSVLGSLNDWNSNFYQGTVLYSETAASTITFGQLCYRTQNETWDLADATAANSAAAYNMLGICVKSSTATNPTSILINGFVETATYATIVKSGEPLYMATTPGSMTKTAPTTSGNAVRLIGNTFWDSNTNTKIIIHFNPDRSWIELT